MSIASLAVCTLPNRPVSFSSTSSIRLVTFGTSQVRSMPATSVSARPTAVNRSWSESTRSSTVAMSIRPGSLWSRSASSWDSASAALMVASAPAPARLWTALACWPSTGTQRAGTTHGRLNCPATSSNSLPEVDQQALGEALVAVVEGVDGFVGEIDRVEQAVLGAQCDQCGVGAERDDHDRRHGDADPDVLAVAAAHQAVARDRHRGAGGDRDDRGQSDQAVAVAAQQCLGGEGADDRSDPAPAAREEPGREHDREGGDAERQGEPALADGGGDAGQRKPRPAPGVGGGEGQQAGTEPGPERVGDRVAGGGGVGQRADHGRGGDDRRQQARWRAPLAAGAPGGRDLRGVVRGHRRGHRCRRPSAARGHVRSEDPPATRFRRVVRAAARRRRSCGPGS